MESSSYSDWLKTFSLANRLFHDNNIEHVFIKMLLNPFHMRDVDVLIPNVSDEKRAIELLRKEGFHCYRAGRLLHPWKIICDGSPIKHLSIDLHQDVEWNRTKVGDGGDMASRRVLTKVANTEAYLPTPEDSFYLIATHAYAQHLTITRPEVLNGISLVSDPKFSWDRVYALAEKFGTFDSIYTFLLAIRLESKNAVNGNVLKRFSRAKICRYVDRWFDSIKKPKFPLLIPKWLGCIFSSFTHTPALIGKVKAEDLAFDFLSFYMRITGERGAMEA